VKHMSRQPLVRVSIAVGRALWSCASTIYLPNVYRLPDADSTSTARVRPLVGGGL